MTSCQPALVIRPSTVRQMAMHGARRTRLAVTKLSFEAALVSMRKIYIMMRGCCRMSDIDDFTTCLVQQSALYLCLVPLTYMEEVANSQNCKWRPHLNFDILRLNG